MSGKNSPTMTGSLTEHLSGLISDARAALAELPLWERYIHIFWLAGPFILLIERSPADLWLSVLAIAFLVRSAFTRDTSWLRVFWVRATFLFWSVCIVSALVSEHPAYSLGETLAWIRFPLFAMATVFWLAQDRRLHMGMLALVGVGLVIMCGILSAEFILIGQEGGNRLTWPYGDLVPGSYLAKTCMPTFAILVAIAASSTRKISLLAGAVSIFSMIISFLTGERINFLLRLCGGLLAGLSWRVRLRQLVAVNLVIGALAVVAVGLLPTTAKRYSTDLKNAVSLGQESEHFRVIAGGFVAFEQSPILGIGPGNYTLMSPEILKDRPDRKIDVHPHNFYVQLLAETGVVGFVTGIIFILSILTKCILHSWRNRENIVCATSYIAPLAFFWPIASTADFFGQWNNIFMWSGLALSLAATNLCAEQTED